MENTLFCVSKINKLFEQGNKRLNFLLMKLLKCYAKVVCWFGFSIVFPFLNFS